MVQEFYKSHQRLFLMFDNHLAPEIFMNTPSSPVSQAAAPKRSLVPTLVVIGIAFVAGAAFTNFYTGKQLKELTIDQTTQESVSERLADAAGKDVLNLTLSRATDNDMDEVAKATKLRFLHLGHSSVSFVGLEKIANLKALQELDLSNTEITDKAVTPILAFSLLESLDVSYTSLTPEGISEFAKLASLRELRLRGTKTNDAAIQSLAGLNQLRILGVSFTEITNNAIPEIVKLANLEELRIANTAIDDDGVKQLSALPNLRILSLSNNQITDASMETRVIVKCCVLRI